MSHWFFCRETKSDLLLLPETFWSFLHSYRQNMHKLCHLLPGQIDTPLHAILRLDPGLPQFRPIIPVALIRGRLLKCQCSAVMSFQCSPLFVDFSIAEKVDGHQWFFFRANLRFQKCRPETRIRIPFLVGTKRRELNNRGLVWSPKRCLRKF